jgi:transposase
MQITTIGLDLAKNVFQVHGIDREGKVCVRRSLRRSEVVDYFAKLPPCLVGIEACATAHHWAREIGRFGHMVRLMPPAYVKPYVKRNKNDMADAEAICEAVTRPDMRFVAVKTAAQQSVLMLHRCRALLVWQRTMLANAIRAHLAEFGIAMPQGIRTLLTALNAPKDTMNMLPDLVRIALTPMTASLVELGQRIKALEVEIGRDVASQLIVRMRWFGPSWAFNYANLEARVLKLTASAKRLSTCEIGLSCSRRSR